MNVIFGDDSLERLATDPEYTAGKSPAIVRAYRKLITLIQNADDERDFYNLKSLHFEKLHGKRKYQHSMRINDRYRLIIELGKETSKRTVVTIIGIEDYH